MPCWQAFARANGPGCIGSRFPVIANSCIFKITYADLGRGDRTCTHLYKPSQAASVPSIAVRLAPGGDGSTRRALTTRASPASRAAQPAGGLLMSVLMRARRPLMKMILERRYGATPISTLARRVCGVTAHRTPVRASQHCSNTGIFVRDKFNSLRRSVAVDDPGSSRRTLRNIPGWQTATEAPTQCQCPSAALNAARKFLFGTADILHGMHW